jgi:hypothetical protein
MAYAHYSDKVRQEIMLINLAENRIIDGNHAKELTLLGIKKIEERHRDVENFKIAGGEKTVDKSDRLIVPE